MGGGKNNIDLVYPELSYTVVGVLFDVYNALGPGYKEVYYERAVARGLERAGLTYKRQMPYKVTYRGDLIGRCYFDFLVENKIILELKKGDYFSRRGVHQANEYLKASGLLLALLVNFTSNGVRCKRIVNLKKDSQAAY